MRHPQRAFGRQQAYGGLVLALTFTQSPVKKRRSTRSPRSLETAFHTQRMALLKKCLQILLLRLQQRTRCRWYCAKLRTGHHIAPIRLQGIGSKPSSKNKASIESSIAVTLA